MRFFGKIDLFFGVIATTLVVSQAAFAAETRAADQPELEFPSETVALVAATSALFDTIENTGPKRANRIPVIQLPKLEERIVDRLPQDQAFGALDGHGPVRQLTGYRISWYPVDRLLGSVDFMGTWDANQNLVCGYLTWDLSDPTAPVLETMDANFVKLETLLSESQSEVHRILLEANCAFGAIDANYGFFEQAG